jgi:hypothetical protein
MRAKAVHDADQRAVAQAEDGRDVDAFEQAAAMRRTR